MLDREFCESLFDMASPWHIIKVEKRKHKNRVDIWVSTSGGARSVRQWFRRSIAPGAQSDAAIWQHLGFGDCRVYIHASLNEDRSVPWLGEKNCPFSRALARRVVELFSERLSYRAICSLLDVDLDDVWTIKHALDSGELQLGDSPVPTHLERKASLKQVDHNEGHSRVPPIEDPIWLQVLNSDVEINVRQLGLKLLLNRVRSQFNHAYDDETKMLRMNELRKYFVKHERFLQYELKQMKH